MSKFEISKKHIKTIELHENFFKKNQKSSAISIPASYVPLQSQISRIMIMINIFPLWEVIFIKTFNKLEVGR